MTATAAPVPSIQLPARLGMDAESIRRDFTEKLFYELMKFPGVATTNDYYLALSYVIRDRLLERWVRSAQQFFDGENRSVSFNVAVCTPTQEG